MSDYDDDFDDYSNHSGFLGWIGRDPLLRVCVMAEVLLWTIFAFVASCCLCVFRRNCRLAEKNNNYHHVKVKPSSSNNNDSSTSSSLFKPCESLHARRLLAFALCVVVGFVSMVIALATAIPRIMPHALFLPESCDGADWCQRVPGAQNLFVKTKSGNNVSLRLFPAKRGGKYIQKGLSLMYSNPNAGYTTRGYESYEKLSLFGISVYAWDYPGYMLSSGRPNYTSVLEAGEAVLNFVAAHSIRKPEDVVLLGRSLGGAVSIALAQKFGSRNLILVNSLDSLQLLLADCCVLSGWASGLNYAKGHFDAAESLASFDGCLFQYAAENDAIVDFRRQRRLFFDDSAYKREQCSVFVEGNGMGHNDDQWGQNSFVKALNVYFEKVNQTYVYM